MLLIQLPPESDICSARGRAERVLARSLLGRHAPVHQALREFGLERRRLLSCAQAAMGGISADETSGHDREHEQREDDPPKAHS